MPVNFAWAPGSPLPEIKDHSIRKLDVIRKYLDVYFDTVISNPRMDCLNITLVDGFCGGGAYRRGQDKEYGSPLVLLKAVEEAKIRLNADREKPLEIKANFIFVDEEPNHIGRLREEIQEEGFADRIGKDITLIEDDFVAVLPNILETIKSGQRAGRSIFILDQFGYSDVPMASIQKIFSALNRPEVILTFAIDAFLNYLREESAVLDTYRQFGVDDAFIAEWNANKNDKNLGRLVTQRALMSKIRQRSGAEFFTPFMLWSPTDNREMMLAHLSRHQAARDKMLSVHWDAQNSFKHIGKGSLFSLGFDMRIFESKDALFNFADQDLAKLENELLNELPNEIRMRMIDGSVSVKDVLRSIANRTAGTNDHVLKAMGILAKAREFEVMSIDGIIKRSSSQIKLNDRLIIPQQKPLFALNQIIPMIKNK